MKKTVRNKVYRTALEYRKQALAFYYRFAEYEKPFRYKPVFILGPARSGTTLLYQMLGATGAFCYITNFEHSLWWMRSMALKIEQFQKSKLSGPSGFTSNLGKTEGRWNMSQGFKIWDDVLPSSYPKLTTDELQEHFRMRMRNEVFVRERVWDTPFLGKWPAMAVNPELWQHVFPEACFIRIRRNQFDNAVSVLRSRRNTHADDRKPITRQPGASLSYSGEPGCVQVAAYVHFTNEILDGFENRCESVISVDYNSLCNQPHEHLQSIEQKVNQYSETPVSFDYTYIPEDLEPRAARGLNRDELQEIEQSLKRLKSA